MLAVSESAQTCIQAKLLWNDTEIELVAGQTYRFTASGEWIDWTISCNANGYPSPNWLLRASETFRRAPQADWFALMGAIDRDPQTQFKIGTDHTLAVPKTGRLSCFANDVALMYWNNRGAVQLTVTRIR